LVLLQMSLYNLWCKWECVRNEADFYCSGNDA